MLSQAPCLPAVREKDRGCEPLRRDVVRRELVEGDNDIGPKVEKSILGFRVSGGLRAPPVGV